MRIIASSDFHGRLPYISDKFDLFLICGDICPANDHSIIFQKEWLKNEFSNWINGLHFNDDNSKVVMTWGNHDFVGEKITKKEIEELHKITNGRLIILKHEVYEFQGLKIFGTPYCKKFFNWAFMPTEKTLKKKYEEIPDGIDILISHDSPKIENYGVIHEGVQFGKDCGSELLANTIKEKKPKICFFGHIHSHDHSLRNIDGTWMAGVSYVDERYIPAYYPLILDYNDGNIKIAEFKTDD